MIGILIFVGISTIISLFYFQNKTKFTKPIKVKADRK
mgnify:CR=1 FL=1